jgi:hypothetical protein
MPQRFCREATYCLIATSRIKKTENAIHKPAQKIAGTPVVSHIDRVGRHRAAKVTTGRRFSDQATRSKRTALPKG